MSTDAQFEKGNIVEYTDGDMKDRLAVVKEVTQVNPAQYIIKLTDTNEVTTCGEGINMKGAVHAL